MLACGHQEGRNDRRMERWLRKVRMIEERTKVWNEAKKDRRQGGKLTERWLEG